MDKEYIKIDNTTLGIRKTQVQTRKITLGTLKKERLNLASQLADVDLLIAQAVQLGIVEEPSKPIVEEKDIINNT